MTRHLIAALLLATPAVAFAQDKNTAAPPGAPAEAVARWRADRFGMFIHWGPVSLRGTEIGWSRGAQVPVAEYDALYKRFDPEKFDADAWVAVAKAAGMKYVVLTTKHHDGFCLWDTKLTDYNIMHTPFKRDVVKELAAACKRAGLRFGAYYSACDWHQPDYPYGSPGGRTKKPNPNLKAYAAYLDGQVTELVKNYGPLSTIWFDVPQAYTAEYGIPMVKHLRELQPDLMIDNRAYNPKGVKGPVGDYDTPEQHIGAYNDKRPWETCMTLCRQWAWKPNDTMKSAKECVRTLVLTNGGDGNLLFNVGPMPDGRIEPRQVDRLREMGAWVTKHADAIYGTRGGPWKPGKRLASTRKGDKVYIHLLDIAAGPVSLPAPQATIRSAKILGGDAVPFAVADGMLKLDVPDAGRDAIDTVVELTVAGPALDIPVLDDAPPAAK